MNNKFKVFLKVFTSILLSLASLIFLFNTNAYASNNAIEITRYCSFSASSNNSSFKYALDGKYSTEWVSSKTSSRYVDISVDAAHDIGGIYLLWDRLPKKWELLAKKSDNSWTKVAESTDQVYLIHYIRVPEEYKACKSFRLSTTPKTTSSEVNIAEIEIYGPGEPPYYAPEWETLEKKRADMLTIVAHPDDEDLYMGVPPPTYADQGYECATVYMTYGDDSKSVRRYEALESAWSLGNKYYPVRGNFIDVKRTTKEEMMRYWPLDDTIGFIVEQIRKYKPSVVVTHDVNGEYGHGAHKLTMYATALAFDYAGNPDKYPSSAEKYGTWTPGKLYVHLYGSNKLNTMSLSTPLSSFGGRTVLKVVDDAYIRHDSQLPGRSLPVDGSYDMRKFGLYDTNLGQDTNHDTMFEHVSDQAMLNLNPWYLYYMVDRSALEQTLNSAKSKVEAHYTAESWVEANLSNIIEAAQAVFDYKDSTQEQVDEQTILLNEAIGKLRVFLTDLQITQNPSKLVYLIDEPIALANMTAESVYSDESRKTVTLTEENVSGFDSSMPACLQEITLTYEEDLIEKSDTYYVDVLPIDGEKIQSNLYVSDTEKRLLKKVYPHTTQEELYSNILNSADSLILYDCNNELYSGEHVGSGAILRLFVDDVISDVMILSVLADVNGDGEVSIIDYTMIRLDILELSSIDEDFFDASDINADGQISIIDYTLVRLDILGLRTIEPSPS